MLLAILAILSILSLFKLWDKAWDLIIKNKNIISWIIYALCFASLLFLLKDDNHKTWELSLWLLEVILLLPILSKVFKLSIPIRLMLFRKELWILMWVLAFIHSLQYFIKPWAYMFWEKWFWIFNWNITFLAFWFLWIIIAIILTVTSNNYSIKKLWKKWKLLHRLAYILLISVFIHVILLKNLEDLSLILLLIIIYFILKTLEWNKISFNIRKVIYNLK